MEINGVETVKILNIQAFQHAITKHDIFNSQRSLSKLKELDVYTFNDHYSSESFQGIMPDRGAAGVSTAGKQQFHALQKIQPEVKLDHSSKGDHKIRFGKGTAMSLGTACVKTPLGPINFHIVPTNTPFLLCLQDMDKIKVKFDNLKNVIVQGHNIVPIIRK